MYLHAVVLVPGIFFLISFPIFEFGSPPPSLSLMHTLIQYGNVPLVIAAGKGHTKIVQRLLEAGANVKYQDKVMAVNVQLPCK